MTMRNKEGNKETAILESAIKIFAKLGYHNSRISQIAKDAGIASGSIYLYYKNKEDLLARIFQNVWEQLYKEISLIQKRRDLSAIDKIEFLVDLIFDIFSANPPLATVFVNEQIHLKKETNIFNLYYDKFFNTGEKIIEAGIKDGTLNSNLNVTVFKFFLLGGMKYLLENWAKDSKGFQLNTLRQNVKLIIKKGILK
jgi:TetR/AcrR family transcriptional regulator, fatty acid metabolism regulator protein